MREIVIKLSDDEYRRLLRIAKLDAEEYGFAAMSDDDYVKHEIYYGIESEIECGENYWGREEDATAK